MNFLKLTIKNYNWLLLIAIICGLLLLSGQVFGWPRFFTASSPISRQVNPLKIGWSQKNIEVILSRGEIKSQKLTFVSNKDLRKIVLEPTSEIAGFLNIEPAFFNNIAANIPQTINLSFNIPENAEFGTFEGVIHLKNGVQAYAQKPKVVVKVWKELLDSDLGFKVKFPPELNSFRIDGGYTLSTTKQRSALEGSTGEEIDIITESNPDILPLADWLFRAYHIDLSTVSPESKTSGLLPTGQEFLELFGVVPSENPDNIHTFISVGSKMFIIRAAPRDRFQREFSQIMKTFVPF